MTHNDDGARRLRRAGRRDDHGGPADTAPACPGCNRPLSLGPGEAGLVGICENPNCPEGLIRSRRLEDGRLIVAERQRR
jgi:hypothetical protein